MLPVTGEQSRYGSRAQKASQGPELGARPLDLGALPPQPGFQPAAGLGGELQALRRHRSVDRSGGMVADASITDALRRQGDEGPSPDSVADPMARPFGIDNADPFVGAPDHTAPGEPPGVPAVLRRSASAVDRLGDVPPAGDALPAVSHSSPLVSIASTVIRRAILDPTFEDDVFDIEEAKRRARVSDMQGGTIGANDPRKAMLTEHLQGTGRAPGPPKETVGEPGRIGAKDPRKAMLTEHLQGTGRAPGLPKETVGEPGRIGAKDPRKAMLTEHLQGTGRAQGLQFGARDTLEAKGFGTPVSGGDHSAVEKVAAAHPAQVEAKAEVESDVEKERPKKLLAEGHRYEGTERASAEVALFDEAVARQDWIKAKTLLGQIKTLAKDRLDAALNGFTTRKPEMATAMKGLPYRLPANFRDLGQAMVAAHTNKEWLTVGGLLKELLRIVDASLDFKTRLDAVKKKAEGLTNPQQHKNLVSR